MIINLKNGNATELQASGNPIKISGYKDLIDRKQAPDLNGDRKKILKEFGIKD